MRRRSLLAAGEGSRDTNRGIDNSKGNPTYHYTINSVGSVKTAYSCGLLLDRGCRPIRGDGDEIRNH